MSTPCGPTSLRAIAESAYREANVHPGSGSIPAAWLTARRAGVDQRREQHPADAFALRIGGDVDGILHREAIGRPRAIGIGVGVAGNAAAELGDEVGVAGVGDGLEAAQHLLLVRRLQLEA